MEQEKWDSILEQEKWCWLGQECDLTLEQEKWCWLEQEQWDLTLEQDWWERGAQHVMDNTFDPRLPGVFDQKGRGRWWGVSPHGVFDHLYNSRVNQGKKLLVCYPQRYEEASRVVVHAIQK